MKDIEYTKQLNLSQNKEGWSSDVPLVVNHRSLSDGYWLSSSLGGRLRAYAIDFAIASGSSGATGR